MTKFRIIEPNLYGAGLSPPLFVRVIKVPNYRSPNYQGNTVLGGAPYAPFSLAVSCTAYGGAAL